MHSPFCTIPAVVLCEQLLVLPPFACEILTLDIYFMQSEHRRQLSRHGTPPYAGLIASEAEGF